jgi:mRNA-degrading endonuclease toxin of MazEF toxin-antitoxin module
MKTVPQRGEVWFVDLGLVAKPRYALVLAAQCDARLALASVVLITTQFDGTSYEVTLPRVRWLREQSYINVQSIQPVKFTEFVRKAPGTFYVGVLGEVEAALKRWLGIQPTEA